MSDPKPAEQTPKGPLSAPSPKYEGNPALRMLGLPRLRARLPSRNWLLFFSITGSFLAAVTYDRRQKKKVQQKWCNAVSHLAEQTLSPEQMPRRITVFLEAPPGDYLLAAREHFTEFIKPILVAAAVDWEMVEGRKEGDVRHKLAAKIRERRRRAGETCDDGPDIFSESAENAASLVKRKGGANDSDEVGGDLVVGRHTWKEYIRGLHEGWLGPMDPPLRPSSDNHPSTPERERARTKEEQQSGQEGSSQPLHEKGGDSKATANGESEFAPYINPSEYAICQLPDSIPTSFQPAVAVGFPHLLGFLNTPVRIWRFINRRSIAEHTGAIVTEFILSTENSMRRFNKGPEIPNNIEGESQLQAGEETSHLTSLSEDTTCHGELEAVLQDEEGDWHKSARKASPEGEETRERPWQEPMVVDSRISERMRTVGSSVYSAKPGNGVNATRSSWKPADAVGEIVAGSAGNVLAGSSGGSNVTEFEHRQRNKGIDWKGSADPRKPVTWSQWLRQITNKDNKGGTPAPWKQGLENNE